MIFFSPNYFFVDSEDGHCYLFDEYGNEKDVSLVYEIYEAMIPKDIKKIVIHDGATNIEYNAFWCCDKLISVTIGNSVTSIGSWAFSSCDGLTSVTIPDSVVCIGAWAFNSCNKLTNIIIPDSVVSIGFCAFHGCNNLKSLVFKNKTMKQIKSMENYPFGIKDESIIKCELN